MNQEEKLKRWRLILGKQSDPESRVALQGMLQNKDEVLEALYDSDQKRRGGLGGSTPKVNRWLGDIRKYFPRSVVQIMQKDAFERLNLEKMLLEPEFLESVEPDVHLAGTLLSLSKVMPAQTKETARLVVGKVVKKLEKKLKNPMRQAVQGSIHRAVRNRRPRINEIDWHRTIRANLKHYQPDLNAIIPERLIGYGKKGSALRRVILLIDQSGSMTTSVVYASVFAAILASIRSLKTHVVAFDTEVVDLTSMIADPVDLLFGIQLGGGTDINRAVGYGQQLVQNPADTIMFIITDLFEGGNEAALLQKINHLKQSGVQLIVLLALNDEGSPMYDHALAEKLFTLGIPSFACTPDQFPDLMIAAIKKENVFRSMEQPT